MFYNLRQHFLRSRFNSACHGVYHTLPVHAEGSSLVILTLLSHADITMYLIAIKSLYRHIREGRIVVLNDGSLDERDQNLLEQHIPGVKVIPIQAVETGRCPKGGCWERLVLAVTLSQTDYVIQMDSDTVTVGDLEEVLRAYHANESFTLGTPLGQRVVSVEESYHIVKHSATMHVQTLAEKSLCFLGGSQGRKYVRGGAAFAGFARGTFSKAFLEDFSVEMEQRLGKKWREWGSEQVASNYLIANSPLGWVLPYPKYASFDGMLDPTHSTFLHFMGTHRFDKCLYLRQARGVVQLLSRPDNEGAG